jgi:ferredoxin-type protein NapG
MKAQVNRRDFIASSLSIMKPEKEDHTSDYAAETQPYLLIPGCTNSEDFLEECTQCYDCIASCPHDALQVWRGHELEFYGFPVILPHRQPCLLCDDYPCITACSGRALRIAHSGQQSGIAVINENYCLAFRGTLCQAFVTNCPEMYAAIRRNAEWVPVVEEKGCTGCGICASICPSENAAIAYRIPAEWMQSYIR